MTETNEIQAVQQNTGRYQIGEKVVAVYHKLRTPTGSRLSAGFSPWRDDLVEIQAIVLTCAFHHRTPNRYNHEELHDGYQFVDEKTGSCYNNQFPYSDNGQITDANDWTFRMDDGPWSLGHTHSLRDITYIAAQIQVAIEDGRSAAARSAKNNELIEASEGLERSQILENYMAQLKQLALKHHFKLEFRPVVWKNKDGIEEVDSSFPEAYLEPINQGEQPNVP